MSQLELVTAIRDFNKAKMKIDELQSILASEIKSRNHSEDILQQQIALSRSNQGAEEGGGIGHVIGRINALSDHLRTLEDSLESEKISVNSLRDKLSVMSGNIRDDTRSQMKDVLTDIDNHVAMQHAAKEERKQLAENIVSIERILSEQKESLRAVESKVISVEEDGLKSAERLKAKFVEELNHMRTTIDVSTSDLQELLVAESNSRTKSVRNIRDDLEDLQKRILVLDSSWQTSFSDGLREMSADFRSAKEANASALQEIREVLSAEITSRRKTAGKISTSLGELSSLSQKNTADLHSLAGEVEERFGLLDANLCKVTSSFSDQITTLQSATKNAVRTLQSEQKTLTVRITELAEENKLATASVMAEIKKLSERQLKMETALTTRIDAMDQALSSMTASVESRCVQVEKKIIQETTNREHALRSTTELIADNAMKAAAQVEESSNQLSYKVTVEAQTRAHIVHTLEKRLMELIGRDRNDVARELKTLEAQLASNLAYAITAESQSRAQATSQLDSKIRDAEIESERRLLQAVESVKNSISYAISVEAQTRAHSVNSLEGRIKEALHVRSSTLAGDVLAVQAQLSEQSQVLASNIISVESRLTEALSEKCDAIVSNVKSIDHRMSEESGICETLATTGSSLEKKLTETRAELNATKRETDELKNMFETFRVSWTKESVDHQERVQAMQETIDDLQIMKEIKSTPNLATVPSSDMTALVEVTKVKHAVKELAASWKEELAQSKTKFNKLENVISTCALASDMDELEVRYTVDRLVSDVLQESKAAATAANVAEAVTQIGKAKESIKKLTISCDECFELADSRISTLSSTLQQLQREVERVDANAQQRTKSSIATLSMYVDDSVSDVKNRDIVSETLSFIIDNVVESDMVSSIDENLDNVRLELKLDVLEQMQKVLSEPLYEMQKRQTVIEEKLGEYDIAFIQKQLRDFHRNLEGTNDEIEALKTDVNDDLRQRLLSVVSVVENLSSR